MKTLALSMALVAALAATGACLNPASAQPATPAAAPDASAAPSPFEALMQRFDLATSPEEPPDFVRKSRPPASRLHFLPLGGRRNEPAEKVMTPGEIRAEEASLQDLRLRHDRLSGRRSAPLMKTSAAGPATTPAKKPYQPGCVLTCAIK